MRSRSTTFFDSVSAKSINVLGRAFDDAWTIAKEWTPVSARAEVRNVTLMAVFEMARVGERDPHRMAFFAVSRARHAVARHLARTGSHRLSSWKANRGQGIPA
jgi:hypothetical protein